MPEVLIRAENVGKKFCRDLKKSLWYGVQDSVNDLLRRESQATLRSDEFWANDDISFELKRGECLALLGRNGAGKTTLLKMLNGLMKPDTGHIQLRGRVAALIALGAGFNPILTGRENILVNGSILGLSRQQIKDRIDCLIAFAEISEALDAPIRTYSSGMKVRLGFAIAANLIEPDILLLDEVLAVGDIGFVIKCMNRVQQLMNRAAVIFVSHNMQFVSRFCTRAILLDHGQNRLDTDPPEAIRQYHQHFNLQPSTSGSGLARVLESKLFVNGVPADSPEPSVRYGDEIEMHCVIDVDPTANNPVLRAGIMDRLRVIVAKDFLGHDESNPYHLSPGKNHIRIVEPHVSLNQGRYSFILSVADGDSQEIFHRSDGNAPFVSFTETLTWGMNITYGNVTMG